MTNESKIVNGIQYKKCSKCKQFKPLQQFYKIKRGTFGVKSECKKCSIIRFNDWIENNRSKYLKTGRMYASNRYRNDPVHRERAKQMSREWRKNNPDYLRNWKLKNPEQQREWVKANPDYHRERQRIFRKENPDYYRNLRAMKQKV